jgi:hypothetical protein
MRTLRVIHCKNCRVDVFFLRPSFLERIIQYQVGLPKEKATLDFVCKDCGNGYRYCLGELREQEDSWNCVEDQDLSSVSLKCIKEECLAHARVHTPAATGSSGTTPALAVAKWNLDDAIRCSDGHPAKKPFEPLTSSLDKEKR